MIHIKSAKLHRIHHIRCHPGLIKDQYQPWTLYHDANWGTISTIALSVFEHIHTKTPHTRKKQAELTTRPHHVKPSKSSAALPELWTKVSSYCLNRKYKRRGGPQSVCYPLSVSTHHIHKDRMEAGRQRGREAGGGETRVKEVKDVDRKRSADKTRE